MLFLQFFTNERIAEKNDMNLGVIILFIKKWLQKNIIRIWTAWFARSNMKLSSHINKLYNCIFEKNNCPFNNHNTAYNSD